MRNTFKVPKFGVVAGCYVTEGTIPRSAQVRLLRDNRVIYEGKVGSLRRFKDDVSEVKQGFECGIGLDRYQDVKVGDVIEAFQIEKVAGVMEGSQSAVASASATAAELTTFMVIAYAVFDLHLPGCRGLKEKRMVAPEPQDPHPQRVRGLGRRGRTTRTCSSAAQLARRGGRARPAAARRAAAGDPGFVESNFDGEILISRTSSSHV